MVTPYLVGVGDLLASESLGWEQTIGEAEGRAHCPLSGPASSEHQQEAHRSEELSVQTLSQGLLWSWWLMTKAGWPRADKVWLGLEGVGIGDPGKKTGGWCIWMAWVDSGRGLGLLKPPYWGLCRITRAPLKGCR